MKKIFMLILFCVLAYSQIFSQKTLPPGAKPYTDYLSSQTVKLLDACFSETTDAALKSRSELQLDSTITFFGYNLSGTQDSTLIFRTVHTYNASLGAAVVVEDMYENSEWIHQSRTTFIFDNLDRLVDVFTEMYDPITQTWTLDSRAEFFPRGTSPDLLDSFLVSTWDPSVSEWVRLFSVWNTFNAQEKLAVSLSQIDLFGTPLLLKDVYSYDLHGDNSLIETFLTQGGFDFPTGKQEFTYSNHYITSATTFSDDGLGGWMPQERITYEYTNFWKESIVNTYAWDFEFNEWILIQSDSLDYDMDLRLTSKTSALYDPELADTTISRTTYEYIQDEYISLEINFDYDFDLQDFVLLDKKYYYYSGGPISEVPNVPIVQKSLVVSPNPATGFVQVHLKEEVNVQVFDMRGQLVRRFSLQPGQMTLDFFDLPAGVYQLSAKTGTTYYTGKLVKQ